MQAQVCAALTGSVAARATDDDGALLPRIPTTASLLSRLQLVHIPKTGGTTLEQLGLEMGVHWGATRLNWPGGRCGMGCPGTWQPCSAWHIPPATYRAHGEDPYQGFDTFCVLRHPYTRAISEFIFSGNPCSAAALNAGLSDVLHQLAAIEPARDVDAAARVRIPGARRGSDCHLLQQSQYACDRILHTESLSADFAALMASRSISMNESRVDQSTRGAVHACKLRVGALNATVRQLLRRVYAADFERGGYSQVVLPSRRPLCSKAAAAASDVAIALPAARCATVDGRISVFADDVVEGGPE